MIDEVVRFLEGDTRAARRALEESDAARLRAAPVRARGRVTSGRSSSSRRSARGSGCRAWRERTGT